jgi:hypothetical protein
MEPRTASSSLQEKGSENQFSSSKMVKKRTIAPIPSKTPSRLYAIPKIKKKKKSAQKYRQVQNGVPRLQKCST